MSITELAAKINLNAIGGGHANNPNVRRPTETKKETVNLSASVDSNGNFIHTAFMRPALAAKKAPTKKMLFSDDEDAPIQSSNN
jgi:shikimate kinase